MAMELRDNLSLTMLITHVRLHENWIRFWAQPDIQQARRIEVALSNLQVELDTGSGFLHQCQLPLNEVFVARFADGKWHRVKILSWPPNNHQNVFVHFIDYGNKQPISVCNIRKLDDYQLVNLTPQAVECHLADVRAPLPGIWPPNIVSFCDENLLYQQVTAQVIGKTEKYPIVRLFSIDNTNFSHVLIQHGLAAPSIPMESINIPVPVPVPPPVPAIDPYRVGLLSTGMTYRVYVSNIESPQKFYIQMTSEEPNRVALMNAMEEFFSTRGLRPLDQVCMSMPCIAKCTEDGKYQRAITLGMEDSGEWKVLFVDTGHAEAASRTKLFAIPQHFMALPVQAVECTLEQSFAGSFNATVFHAVTEAKVLDCCVLDQIAIKRGTVMYVVSLRHQNVDVIELMKRHTPPTFTIPRKSNHLVPYRYPKMRKGVTYQVSVTFTRSLVDFYAGLSENISELDKMMVSLRKDYTQYSGEPVTLEECVPGQAVCARFSEDQLWYRGEVIGITPPDHVKVKFADYGNSELVPLSELRRLAQKFLELPAQAYHLALKGIEDFPEAKTSRLDVVAKFEEETVDKNLIAEVVDIFNEKHYSVVLHCSELGPLNHLMVKFLNAAPVKIKEPELEEVEKLYVSSFISRHEFFGQLQKIPLKQLDTLISELSDFYSQLPPERTKFEIGQLVCTKFSLDQTYYRGKVLSVSGNLVEVFFLDYGNKETKRDTEVWVLQPQFTHFAQQGIYCRLGEVPDSVSTADMEKALDESLLEVKINGKVGDVYEVEVLPSSKENEKLVTLFHDALGSQEYSSPSAPAGVVEDVLVTDVTDPSNFWCQLQTTSELLTELKAEMGKHYNQLQPQEEVYHHPQLGAACVAKYSGDDEWYRARVVGLTNAGTVSVLFVDFGNTETMQPSSVKVIRSRYTQLPQQALNCCLVNVEDQTWPPNVMEEFKALVLDKEFTAVFKGKDSHSEKVNVQLTDSLDNKIDGSAYNKPKTIQKPVYDNMWIDANSNNTPTEQRKPFRKEDSYKSSSPKDDNQWASRNSSSGDRKDHGSASSDVQNGWDNSRSSRNERSYGNKADESKTPWPSRSTSRSDDNWRNNNDRNLPFQESSQPRADSKPVLTNYPDMEIPLMSYWDIAVVYVVSPSEFYCKMQAQSMKLRTMTDKFRTEYEKMSRNECPLNNPTVGMPCCGVSSEDQTWYRGKITAILGSNVEVQFVDYGNSEKVPLQSVKSLKSEYLELPMQALKCCLHNTLPQGDSWSTESVKKFKEMVDVKCMVAQFAKKQANGTYEINIINVDKLKEDVLNKEFADTGYAKMDGSQVLVPRDPCAPALLNYTYPSIELGRKETVTVTWFLNPSEFYCQLSSQEDVLNAKMETMQSFYNHLKEMEGVVDRPHPKMPCVSQFSGDNDAWYRSEIVHVKGNTVGVMYVDYGNCEEVTRKKLKHLTSEFADLPAQGLKCSLLGIKPPVSSSNWPSLSSEDINRFFQGNTACTFESKKAGQYLVRLDNNGSSVAQKLIDAGFASASEYLPAGFTKIKVPLGSDPVPVFAVFAEDAKSFYCQLSETTPELEALMETLEAHYALTEASEADALGEGDPCVAKYSEDNRWYRGLVKSGAENGQYKVWFVDYGNSETVNQSEVRSLAPEYLSLSQQALHCRLYGLQIDPEQSLSDSFVATILDKELTAIFLKKSNDVFAVSLMESDQNLGESIFGELSPEPDEPEVLAVYPQSVVQLGSRSAIVSHVNSPSSFFVQFSDQEDQLINLATHLDEVYSDIEGLIPTDIQLGMACCAKYSEDEAWYRAVVTDINGSEFTVRFIDYGNSETPTLETMKTVTEEFLTIPPFAIECQFLGAKVVSGKEQAFVDGLNGKVVTVELKTEVEPVSVNVTEEETNLLQAMVTSGVVIVESGAARVNFRQADISLGKHATIVSHVASPSSFFVQFSDQEDQLSNLATHLDEVYSNIEGLIPTDVQLGMACCAKYSEDEAWYRAVVLDIDDAAFTVRFIDYGNCDTASLETLKMVTEEFLAIPPFAIECQFLGAKVVPGKEEEFVASLRDKELTVEFKTQVEPVSVSIEDEGGDLLEGLVTNEIVVVEEVVEATGAQHFLRPEIALGSRSVLVSHISSSSNFFVQYSDHLDPLAELATHLDEVYSAAEGLTPSNIHLGMACCAKFSEDEAWYRAVVTEINGSELTVRFIDYGNTDMASLETIKTVTEEFLAIPPFAIECQFMGAKVVSGKDEEFVESLKDKEVTMEFKSEIEPVSVGAVDEEGDLLERLTANGILVVEDVIEAAREAEFVDSLDDQEVATFELENQTEPVSVATTDGSESLEVLVTTEKDVISVDEIGEEVFVDDLNDKDVPVELETTVVASVSVGAEGEGDHLLDRKITGGEVEDVFTEAEENEVMDSLNDKEVEVETPTELHDVSDHVEEDAVLETLQKEVLVGDDLLITSVGVIEESVLGQIAEDGLETEQEEFSVGAKVEENVFVSSVGVIEESVPGQIAEDGLETEQEFSVGAKVEEDLFVTSISVVDETVVSVIQVPSLSDIEETGRQTTDLSDTQVTTGGVEESSLEELKAVQKFPPPVVPLESALAGVSHITSPSSFYVQLSEQGDHKLSSLTCRLNEVYSIIEESAMTDIQLGAACCAKYSEDESWYRAVVTEVRGSELTVRFIDYGNSEAVSMDTIRTVAEEFLAIPPFAIECRFLGATVVSGKDLEFVERLKDIDVSVEFKTLEEPVCVGIKDNGGDVLNGMVVSGIVIVEDVVEKKEVPALPEFPPVVIPATAQLASVSCVTSLDSFYVRLADDAESFGSFHARVQEAYSSIELQGEHIVSPETGMICAALYSQDGDWCRALVMEVKEMEALIKFVDYGNMERVPIETLRMPCEELLSATPFALECRLVGYEPCPGREDEAIIAFADLTLGKKMTVEFKGDAIPFPVTLSHEDCHIGELLFATGKVQETLPIQFTPTESESPETGYKNIHLPRNRKFYVTVTHVISPGEFWIQMCDSQNLLSDLIEEIGNTYGNLGEDELQLTDPEVGQPCMAMFSSDFKWYRAEVLDVSSGKVSVQFVDFGNIVEDCLEEDIKIINPEFLEPPTRAVKCCLAGVSPKDGDDSWDLETCQEFNHLVQGENKKLLAEYQCESGEAIGIRLLDVGMDIAQVLADRNLVTLNREATRNFSDLSTTEDSSLVNDTDAMLPGIAAEGEIVVPESYKGSVYDSDDTMCPQSVHSGGSSTESIETTGDLFDYNTTNEFSSDATNNEVVDNVGSDAIVVDAKQDDVSEDLLQTDPSVEAKEDVSEDLLQPVSSVDAKQDDSEDLLQPDPSVDIKQDVSEDLLQTDPSVEAKQDVSEDLLQTDPSVEAKDVSEDLLQPVSSVEAKQDDSEDLLQPDPSVDTNQDDSVQTDPKETELCMDSVLNLFTETDQQEEMVGDGDYASDEDGNIYVSSNDSPTEAQKEETDQQEEMVGDGDYATDEDGNIYVSSNDSPTEAQKELRFEIMVRLEDTFDNSLAVQVDSSTVTELSNEPTTDDTLGTIGKSLNLGDGNWTNSSSSLTGIDQLESSSVSVSDKPASSTDRNLSELKVDDLEEKAINDPTFVNDTDSNREEEMAENSPPSSISDVLNKSFTEETALPKREKEDVAQEVGVLNKAASSADWNLSELKDDILEQKAVTDLMFVNDTESKYFNEGMVEESFMNSDNDILNKSFIEEAPLLKHEMEDLALGTNVSINTNDDVINQAKGKDFFNLNVVVTDKFVEEALAQETKPLDHLDSNVNKPDDGLPVLHDSNDVKSFEEAAQPKCEMEVVLQETDSHMDAIDANGNVEEHEELQMIKPVVIDEGTQTNETKSIVEEGDAFSDDDEDVYTPFSDEAEHQEIEIKATIPATYAHVCKLDVRVSKQGLEDEQSTCVSAITQLETLSENESATKEKVAFVQEREVETEEKNELSQEIISSSTMEEPVLDEIELEPTQTPHEILSDFMIVDVVTVEDLIPRNVADDSKTLLIDTSQKQVDSARTVTEVYSGSCLPEADLKNVSENSGSPLQKAPKIRVLAVPLKEKSSRNSCASTFNTSSPLNLPSTDGKLLPVPDGLEMDHLSPIEKAANSSLAEDDLPKAKVHAASQTDQKIMVVAVGLEKHNVKPIHGEKTSSSSLTENDPPKRKIHLQAEKITKEELGRNLLPIKNEGDCLPESHTPKEELKTELSREKATGSFLTENEPPKEQMSSQDQKTMENVTPENCPPKEELKTAMEKATGSSLMENEKPKEQMASQEDEKTMDNVTQIEKSAVSSLPENGPPKELKETMERTTESDLPKEQLASQDEKTMENGSPIEKSAVSSSPENGPPKEELKATMEKTTDSSLTENDVPEEQLASGGDQKTMEQTGESKDQPSPIQKSCDSSSLENGPLKTTEVSPVKKETDSCLTESDPEVDKKTSIQVSASNVLEENSPPKVEVASQVDQKTTEEMISNLSVIASVKKDRSKKAGKSNVEEPAKLPENGPPKTTEPLEIGKVSDSSLAESDLAKEQLASGDQKTMKQTGKSNSNKHSSIEKSRDSSLPEKDPPKEVASQVDQKTTEEMISNLSVIASVKDRSPKETGKSDAEEPAKKSPAKKQ